MSSKTKTTATKEEAKPALVPKLRFPEFRDAEGWDSGILGSLSEVVRGGSPRPIDGFLTTAADGLNWLKIGDVDKDAKYVTRTAEKVRPEALSKTRVVNPGDLILSNSMSFGRPYILQIKTCIHDGWIAITHIAKKADRDFLYYSISAPSSQSYFVDNAAGSGVQNLNADIIKALPVSFPTPAEQQKIAECLSSVDELMAAQARKVDALKTHKKGLMQQLFPREGETQPRLRFPEFQNAGEWEVTTIGDLEPFVTSGSRGWAPFYAEQGELFVRITNLWRDSIYLDLTDCKFVQLPPGANEGVRTQLKKHDVLISITADIGIIGYVDESVPSPAYINQHIALVRFDEGQLCGKYVAYFLASEKSQRLFRASTDTGTKAGMSLIGIQKIELMLPGLPEQERIASCLSSLDALITAETQKLEALKTHKKGLMQQLFPSPEEVEA